MDKTYSIKTNDGVTHKVVAASVEDSKGQLTFSDKDGKLVAKFQQYAFFLPVEADAPE